MPLTKSQEKAKEAMKKEYGPEKGESVFYAKENKDKMMMKKKEMMNGKDKKQMAMVIRASSKN